MSYKSALEQYVSVFDGTKKQFSEDIEDLFNNLYHPDFTLVTKERTRETRDSTKQMHSRKLARGTKASIVHIKRIGLSCVDVKLRLVNDLEDITTRVLFTLFDNKMIKGIHHEDTFISTIASKSRSDFYYYLGSGPTLYDHLLKPDDLLKPDEYGEYKNKNDQYAWDYCEV